MALRDVTGGGEGSCCGGGCGEACACCSVEGDPSLSWSSPVAVASAAAGGGRLMRFACRWAALDPAALAPVSVWPLPIATVTPPPCRLAARCMAASSMLRLSVSTCCWRRVYALASFDPTGRLASTAAFRRPGELDGRETLRLEGTEVPLLPPATAPRGRVIGEV